jgi:hypothetical protein
MLAHDHPSRRQLGDLTTPEASRRRLLLVAELVPAPAATVRVVVDEFIDVILVGERAAGALMPRLPASTPPPRVPRKQLPRLRTRLRASLLTRLRGILRRRL